MLKIKKKEEKLKLLKRNTVWLRNIIGRWLQLDNKNDFLRFSCIYIVLCCIRLGREMDELNGHRKNSIFFCVDHIQLVDNSCQNYWREIISFFFSFFTFFVCGWCEKKNRSKKLLFFNSFDWNMILVNRTPFIGTKNRRYAPWQIKPRECKKKYSVWSRVLF